MSNIQILSNLNLPIGKIINQELFNSKSTQIAVAFLKHSGIKIIEQSLKYSLDNGSKFEIIAGLDFKTTDPKSMLFFIDLKKKYPNLKFYCYGDKKQNRNDIVFHPKIYLFENDKEKTSIVGSTNLTGGGLTSNFEVNTIFNEKKPVYFSQLQAIYNSIKFTDSLFTPDEEYLNGYSDVFKAFETSEEKALKDKGISKVIKEIELKSEKLPGTIPSIKSMIIDFVLEKEKIGINKVSVSEITENLIERIKNEKLEDNYKLDTFNNSIRGELNHNELNSNTKNGLKLFERVERGFYSLTENGKNYKGR
ncbi:phospholipase D-like domain-containing protein [Flavobacterium sp.]|jgi:HKD family nuclease|uniref:phospholipase D-like domain-containing protein n=1 Tax=Flavobacterium sp. TaxID=239 RepID=UPI002D01EA84|nr:phospholipase D-like domain-containing protein [Flavobacterium sp.]HQA74233.1 phospholipase D-like domain-containing protein [Flavobacterium sp.]